MTRKNNLKTFLRPVLMPVIIIFILLFFASALNSIEEGQRNESTKQLEAAVRRGCVACYAAEGFYPPDLDYLKENYGITIDEKRYRVSYRIFAENIMPNIKVLELELER